MVVISTCIQTVVISACIRMVVISVHVWMVFISGVSGQWLCLDGPSLTLPYLALPSCCLALPYSQPLLSPPPLHGLPPSSLPLTPPSLFLIFPSVKRRVAFAWRTSNCQESYCENERTRERENERTREIINQLFYCISPNVGRYFGLVTGPPPLPPAMEAIEAMEAEATERFRRERSSVANLT